MFALKHPPCESLHDVGGNKIMILNPLGTRLKSVPTIPACNQLLLLSLPPTKAAGPRLTCDRQEMSPLEPCGTRQFSKVSNVAKMVRHTSTSTNQMGILLATTSSTGHLSFRPVVQGGRSLSFQVGLMLSDVLRCNPGSTMDPFQPHTQDHK